jgi:hypothetical protein
MRKKIFFVLSVLLNIKIFAGRDDSGGATGPPKPIANGQQPRADS